MVAKKPRSTGTDTSRAHRLLISEKAAMLLFFSLALNNKEQTQQPNWSCQVAHLYPEVLSTRASPGFWIHRR